MGTRRDRARADLRRADPVLARLIDAHPGFDPRAWLAGLPPMDAFGALVFQVIGQQLSVRATRSILQRLVEIFDGAFPAPEALLAVPPEELVKVGLSRRKVATLREVARRFADGRWRDDELRHLSDREIEEKFAALAAPVLSKRAQKKVREAVWNLDKLESVSALMKMLKANRRTAGVAAPDHSPVA